MIEAPKAVARPERPVADARDAKAKEVHGNSATAYGYNKNKRDGALMSSGGMANGARAEPNNQAGTDDTRDKKYAQLQSSVFGGGY